MFEKSNRSYFLKKNNILHFFKQNLCANFILKAIFF